MGSLVLLSFCSLFFFCSSLAWVSSAYSPLLGLGRRDIPTLSFDEGYTQMFGDSNLMLTRDGRTVHISLDERTGAGFASQDLYLHGFFSASIKLPSDYAAGVVVAFYMSNGDVFEETHDELDFEFLGNIRGKEWRVQTNIYGNGSTAMGREERYSLWFDPTVDFHQYSILWSNDQIMFYVDGIPIREIKRTEAMDGSFPSKPMSLYATIWDGSNWATAGGRYKVNYKYAPYVAELANLTLHGCAVDPTDHSSDACGKYDSRRYPAVALRPEERSAMERFRIEHMTYSYCYDRQRYPTPPPECSVDPREAKRLQGLSSSARLGGGRRRRRQARGSRRSPRSKSVAEA